MEWFFRTRTFQRLHDRKLKNVPDHLLGQEGDGAGVDDDFAALSFENIGAWIIGRNMFGPIRGPWLNEDWKGWWGDNPVYHCDVFVLTHHVRTPIQMQGGTTFYFVNDGIESALQQAKAAAKDKDVRVGGGVATLRSYLHARLIDELHFAQSPVLLGSGESLFTGLDLLSLGYRCVDHVASSKTTHLVLARS